MTNIISENLTIYNFSVESCPIALHQTFIPSEDAARATSNDIKREARNNGNIYQNNQAVDNELASQYHIRLKAVVSF